MPRKFRKLNSYVSHKAKKDKPFRPSNLPADCYGFISLLQRISEVKKLRSLDSPYYPHGILAFEFKKKEYLLLPQESKGIQTFALFADNDWIFFKLPTEFLISEWNKEMKRRVKEPSINFVFNLKLF